MPGCTTWVCEKTHRLKRTAIWMVWSAQCSSKSARSTPALNRTEIQPTIGARPVFSSKLSQSPKNSPLAALRRDVSTIGKLGSDAVLRVRVSLPREIGKVVGVHAAMKATPQPWSRRTSAQRPPLPGPNESAGGTTDVRGWRFRVGTLESAE